MATSIINSDDGLVSGTSGLKTTGGNDGNLNIQANGTTRVAVTTTGAAVTGTLTVTGNISSSSGVISGDGSGLTGVTASSLSGTLGVSAGGTGQTTYTDGQLLIGNSTGNTLNKATLTAGSGINITNGAGSITIAAAGAGGFSGSIAFNSPGTFSTPPSTNQVFVMVQAGGGGDGGYLNPQSFNGGAGAGGGFAMGVVPVTGGTPVSVTVGSAGTNGNIAFGGNQAPSGNSGGSSSFGNTISANGGGGGTGGIANSGPGPDGTPGNGVAPTGLAISGGPGPAGQGLKNKGQRLQPGYVFVAY